MILKQIGLDFILSHFCCFIYLVSIHSIHLHCLIYFDCATLKPIAILFKFLFSSFTTAKSTSYTVSCRLTTNLLKRPLQSGSKHKKSGSASPLLEGHLFYVSILYHSLGLSFNSDLTIYLGSNKVSCAHARPFQNYGK